MTITPDQAQTLLDGATPGPWRLDDHDNPRTVDAIKPHRLRGVGHPRTYIADVCRPGASPGRGDALAMTAADGTLIAAAPDMAQTIAMMRWEWGVEHLGHVSQWGSRESAEDELGYYLRTGVFIPRLVRRLVGPVEVTE